ncbi:MAG: hypothetical protein LW595_05350 [Rickettsiales bacterium]|nr:hypothetical protein [Rickettsiales bacterium]
MRYSSNLNIILKSIEKAVNRMSRDFVELENLQNNPASALKFATSCYNKIAEIIIDDLQKFRGDFDITIIDSINNKKINYHKDNKISEYSYLVLPIDGFYNLMRANPNFTVAVALQHCNQEGSEPETIALAINNLVGNDIYYCEKGFGAFANNRRIRVSKKNGEGLAISSSNPDSFSDFVQNYQIKKPYFYGINCPTLEMAYLSSAKLDIGLFSKNDYFIAKSFALLAKEAGGKIIRSEEFEAKNINKNKVSLIITNNSSI